MPKLIGRPPKPIKERFAACYTVHPKTGCWLWNRKISERDGYPRFWTINRNERANRFSYRLFKGEFDKELQVLHNCPCGDNRICVNPDHLYLGTHEQNMKDAVAKDQIANKANGRHYAVTRPEIYKRGEDSWAAKNKHRMPRGDANGSRKHPESLKRGEEHHNHKLTKELILKIYSQIKVWKTEAGKIRVNSKLLASKFDLCGGTIRNIARAKIWKHLNLKPLY